MKLSQALGVSGAAVALMVGALALSDHTASVKTEGLPSPGAAEGRCEGQDVAAFVMSHGVVRQRLKAPSTARFPSITAEGVRSIYSGDCTYTVAGYVDAENGFGAKLRTRYVVTIKKEPTTDRWWPLDVQVVEP